MEYLRSCSNGEFLCENRRVRLVCAVQSGVSAGKIEAVIRNVVGKPADEVRGGRILQISWSVGGRPPPAIATRKWTSASGATVSSKPSSPLIPSTLTAMPRTKASRSVSYSRALTPGKCSSSASMTWRTVSPATSTCACPAVSGRSRRGIKTVGTRDSAGALACRVLCPQLEGIHAEFLGQFVESRLHGHRRRRRARCSISGGLGSIDDDIIAFDQAVRNIIGREHTTGAPHDG
jgi:hypothetical protein